MTSSVFILKAALLARSASPYRPESPLPAKQKNLKNSQIFLRPGKILHIKYTEKQIEKFKEMFRNGILEQLEESERVEIIDNIIEIDEATILASCNISTEELVDIADTMNELSALAETATKEYNMRYPEPVGKPKIPNYKQALIGLLGLRAWATKEDIVTELRELL